MTPKHYEQILQASRDFITLIGRDYRYEFVNDSYAEAIGLPAVDITGKSVAEVWGDSKFHERIKYRVDQCFEGKESHDIDQFRFGKSTKYIHVSYYPFVEEDVVTHVMVFSHDVSIVKKLESKLLDFEFKDPTTGLFNRRSFDIVLDMELEKARRAEADRIRAVLFIKLRSISHINANFGYELGNLLLESTALRIKEALRASDYVFRFDGKEFAVILTTLKRGADIPIVVENIRSKTDFPYSHKGTVINVSCNIGAAIYPIDGDCREVVVARAMSALNEAREKNETLVMFNKTLFERGQYVSRLRSDIRTAFVEKQFSAHFQPIVDSAGMIVGAEALIRWQHPELGNIPPDVFIPIAEESGNIAMIGKWVLFQVCRDLKRLGSALGDRYISVNLSSKEFGSLSLVQDIKELLEAEAVSPRSLKLEITESQSMEDIESVIDKIRRLAELGIDVLIDDFGTGYSSLAYIKRLPAKTIKIDKSFVDRIADSDDDLAFIRGVITMIGSKKKDVLVEGVANRGQYVLLRDLGVRYMQGYYFSEPRTYDEFRALLKRGEPLP
ncbi:MAG: EAL domain-containing protein [Spirochaetes bacterium]|nr:EAL domain-containing protein [Spirochaetota bacterium]MBU1079083.1 EAL domain-containing protein [Spirochaetota bacterium]